MKKKYKRALAAALAAVMIWNTCDWHPQVLAGSSVQYIEEVKELSMKSCIRRFRMERNIRIWSCRTS